MHYPYPHSAKLNFLEQIPVAVLDKQATMNLGIPRHGTQPRVGVGVKRGSRVLLGEDLMLSSRRGRGSRGQRLESPVIGPRRNKDVVPRLPLESRSCNFLS